MNGYCHTHDEHVDFDYNELCNDCELELAELWDNGTIDNCVDEGKVIEKWYRERY